MFKDLVLGLNQRLNALREFVALVEPFLQKHVHQFMADNVRTLAPMFLNLMLKTGTIDELGKKKDEIVEKCRQIFDGDLQVVGALDGPIEDVKLDVKPRRPRHFVDTMKRFHRSSQYVDDLYASALVSLESTAEVFFAQLLHAYYTRNPAAKEINEKPLRFEELSKFVTLEEARRFCIDSQVEDTVRAGFDEWVRFLREKLKLSMSYLNPVKGELEEVFLRRNLVVHNGGIVNTIYLRKVDPKLSEGLLLGQRVPISAEYLASAINLIEWTFSLIASELWKKQESDDHERGETLIELAFQHLCAERWKIGEALSRFVADDGALTDQKRLYALLNYWQSLKWQDRFEEVRADVQSHDFSASELIYRLAQIALLDKNDDFYALLPGALASNQLKPNELSEWPIFREIRKDDRCRPHLPETSVQAGALESPTADERKTG